MSNIALDTQADLREGPKVATESVGWAVPPIMEVVITAELMAWEMVQAKGSHITPSVIPEYSSLLFPLFHPQVRDVQEPRQQVHE